MFLGPIIQIGDCQLRSESPEYLGAAPGNRLGAGDADNQPLAPLECDLAFGKYGNVHGALALARLDGRMPHSNAIVCRAIISSSSVGTTRTGVVPGRDIRSECRAFSAGS